MKRLAPTFFVALVAISSFLPLAQAQNAVLTFDGLANAGNLPSNDDGYSGTIPLNIGGESGINFFGQNFTSVFVNNNGNLTFSSGLGTFTPNGLATGVGQPIIAPFFADVYTFGTSGIVNWGNATVSGHNAFVVNYPNVAYFAEDNKHNTFQVILIDRSDTGAGNFDIEFNYNQILWETGEASGGTNGLGGTSAVAGYSNGLSGNANVFYQLPGSLMNGALLDGGPNALISGKVNSTVNGRYIFFVRSGVVMTVPSGSGPLTVVGAGNLGTVSLGSPIGGGLYANGGTPPYSWSLLGSLPAGITANPPYFSGTTTQPGNYSVSFAVVDAAKTGSSGSISWSVFGISDTSLPPGIPFAPYLASLNIAGGALPYSVTFSGLPKGLSGTSSGTIQGIVTAPGTFSVAVTVTDVNGISASKTLPLVFAIPPPLSVSATVLAAGALGQTYSQVLGGGAGGAPPYLWSFVSGSLPDGLSLHSGGTISGIPSKIGTFTFAVRATDYTGASAVGSVSLTIAPIPVSIMFPTLPAGMAGVEYPSQQIMVQGGAPPISFTSSGGLQSSTSGGEFETRLAGRASSASSIQIDSNGVVSGTPASAGAYSFNVTATDSAGHSSSGTLGFTVRSYSTDLILSAGSVDFTLAAGSVVLPFQQTIGVQSTNATVPIQYNVSVSGAPASWFTFAPNSGTTPNSVSVSLAPGALSLPVSATPYTANITITCASSAPCAGNTQSFAVNLTVKTVPPQLKIGDLISFSATPGSTQVMSQSVGLQNIGGGTIGFASVSCAASWCSVGGVPGSVAGGQSAAVSISVDPSTLTSGFYRTTLTLVASTGTASVPVTVFISALPALSLQPSGEQFQSVAGGIPNGPLQSFLIDVSGSGQVGWSATVLPGASWLSIAQSSGTASASQPGQGAFSLDPTIVSGLKAGTYYGTVRVTTAGVVNSPQDFEVVLNVAPVGTQQRPNPSPAGLLFIAQPGVAPPPQTVTVSTGSNSPVNVQASTTTSDGGNWLAVTPATGSAQPANPLMTQVSVDTSKLAPGVYYGGVNYAYTGVAIRTVSVTVIVNPALPKASEALPSDGTQATGPQAAAAGCTPGVMAAAQTGLVTNFAQPTAWPTPLQMLLLNDCGTPVANGQIVATFSNGDPPLAMSLANGTTGLYSATWTPRKTAQQTTITMRATAPGFAAVTTQLVGSVTPGTAPLLDRNSTQHLYNPLPAGGLAPGTLVQVSGTGLSATSATAPAGPLPTTLNGTQVLIGGIAAPLSSVTPGVLNAALPFELVPGMQYQIVVSANGALTTPDMIDLIPDAPGIAATVTGLVSASHADNSAVTEASPAAPGETITMVAAGLGLTDTAVADGAPSPSSPLANAVTQPNVTVDGTPATVTFAGLQAGMVGVYQIIFTVPTGARTGDLPLIVTQADQTGNPGILPVKATKP